MTRSHREIAPKRWNHRLKKPATDFRNKLPMSDSLAPMPAFRPSKSAFSRTRNNPPDGIRLICKAYRLKAARDSNLVLGDITSSENCHLKMSEVRVITVATSLRHYFSMKPTTAVVVCFGCSSMTQ